MRYILYVILGVFVLIGCESTDDSGATLEGSSQTDAVAAPDSASDSAFEDVMAYAREEQLHERPVGEIMQAVGLRFMGRPYVTGILDESPEETLVCRLDGFDCVTFVETALAMARGIENQDYTYSTFQNYVQDQRYRDGEMGDYCTRLHYFTDWIADNEERGTVDNISQDLGGVQYDKNINFMGTHRDSYPRLVEDDQMYACIQEMEQSLQGMDLYYIPQDRISSVYDQLQAGDIIATATDIEGLDVTHTGLVHDNGDGTMGFLHASTSGGVKVSPDLQEYIESNSSQIGIIVARPQG